MSNETNASSMPETQNNEMQNPDRLDPNTSQTKSDLGKSDLTKPDLTKADSANETSEKSALQEEASDKPKEEEVRGATPGPAEGLFHALATIAPIILAIFTALIFGIAFYNGGYYSDAEVNFVRLFYSLPSKDLFTPVIDGQTLLPVTYWSLQGIAYLLQKFALNPEWLFPCYGLICAILAVLAAGALGIAAGFGKNKAFAAGLLLLITPAFLITGNMLSNHVLALALMLFALAGFCRGWNKNCAPFSMIIGFVFALLAGLAGGVAYVAIPIATSIIFLILRLAFRRAQKWDALLGFGLALIILGLWIASLIFHGSASGYGQILLNTFLGKNADINLILNIFLPKSLMAILTQPWQQQLALLGLYLVPWLLIIIFVSWIKAGKDGLEAVKNSDHRAGFIWLALIIAVVLFFFYPHGGMLAILGILAPLFARALLRLAPIASKLFYLILGLLILHIGIFTLFASFERSLDLLARMNLFSITEGLKANILSLHHYALIALGLIAVLSAIILLRFTKKIFPAGSLLVLTLAVILMNLPVRLHLMSGIMNILPGLHNSSAIAQSNIQKISKTKVAPTPTEAKPEVQTEVPTEAKPEVPTEAKPTSPDSSATSSSDSSSSSPSTNSMDNKVESTETPTTLAPVTQSEEKTDKTDSTKSPEALNQPSSATPAIPGTVAPETKPEAKETAPAPEAQTEAKVEEAKSEASPEETKTEAKASNLEEAKPEAKEANPELTPESVDTPSKSESEAKPEIKQDIQPEAKSEAPANSEAKAESQAEAKTEAVKTEDTKTEDIKPESSSALSPSAISEENKEMQATVANNSEEVTNLAENTADIVNVSLSDELVILPVEVTKVPEPWKQNLAQ